jgi:hypothetical protein
MKILLSLLVKHLVKKALKSATAAVAAGGAVIGGVAVARPDWLDIVPEEYRGYAMLVFAGLTLLARFRGEIGELIAEAKKGG